MYVLSIIWKQIGGMILFYHGNYNRGGILNVYVLINNPLLVYSYFYLNTIILMILIKIDGLLLSFWCFIVFERMTVITLENLMKLWETKVMEDNLYRFFHIGANGEIPFVQ